MAVEQERPLRARAGGDDALAVAAPDAEPQGGGVGRNGAHGAGMRTRVEPTLSDAFQRVGLEPLQVAVEARDAADDGTDARLAAAGAREEPVRVPVGPAAGVGRDRHGVGPEGDVEVSRCMGNRENDSVERLHGGMVPFRGAHPACRDATPFGIAFGTLSPARGRIPASCRIHRGVPLGWRGRARRPTLDVLTAGIQTRIAVRVKTLR